MEELVFIHCADIHLDARFTSTGLTDLKARQRRQELRDVFVRIIDEVIKQKAHMLFISGDLYEHEYTGKDTIDFVICQLNRIPNVKVFIAPGNHDPYTGNSYYSSMVWPANTHIFTGELERIAIPEYQLVVYGAGFGQKYQYDSMLDKSSILHDDFPVKILVVHGTLDGFALDCPYHPVSSREIIENSFTYAALGHIHKYSNFPNGMVYCGSPEPLGFDEPGEHGIIKGVISSEGIRTEFIKTNKRRCISVEIDITDIHSAEKLEEAMKKELHHYQEDLVRFVIDGRKSKDFALDEELLRLRLSESCFYIQIVNQTSPDYDIKELSNEQSLKGIFVRKLLEEIKNTHDRQQRDKLYRALYLGLDAMEDKELVL